MTKTYDMVERLRDLTGDIRDCLEGNISHDTITFRGTLLHQCVEVMVAQSDEIDRLQAEIEKLKSKPCVHDMAKSFLESAETRVDEGSDE